MLKAWEAYQAFTPEEKIALEIDDFLSGRQDDLTVISNEALSYLGFTREETDE
jgi:hypothetical protein